MKKILKTIAYCFIISCLITGSLSSCKKTPKEEVNQEVADISQTSKSIPISCKFGNNNTTAGCTTEMGFCIANVGSLEELDALTLNDNESKGQGWARKQSDGNIVITLSMGTTNIAQPLLTEWMALKSITVASDCIIPNTVVENCLRTDKITFPPNMRLVIPKGVHPLTISLPVGSTKTPEVLLRITANSKCEYIGHVTLLR